MVAGAAVGYLPRLIPVGAHYGQSVLVDRGRILARGHCACDSDIRRHRYRRIQSPMSNGALPLEEPKETYAKLLASGMQPATAYVESRVGAAYACTVQDAVNLPGVRIRVAWLKANKSMVADPPPLPAETLIDPKNITPLDVLKLLLKDHALAVQMGQSSAAVRAAELIGKQMGMFVDRQQIDVTVFDKLELHEKRALLEAIETIEGKFTVTVN